MDDVGGVVSFCTATEPLSALWAVQLRQTAVTLYVYVPVGTAVSLQLVIVMSVVGEVPHAGLGVVPE
jgi:hypothetical protein